MNKKRFGLIAIASLLLVSQSACLVGAQNGTEYRTQITTPIVIGANGSFAASEPNVDVSYEISGIPGATGTVTATVYNGNPQATANIRDGVSLFHFVAVNINMNENEFIQAKISIKLEGISGIDAPYTVYKYVADNDSFVQVPATVDMETMIATVTLGNLSDLLFAIGGVSSEKVAFPASSWLVLVVSVFVIVILVGFSVYYLRGSAGKRSLKLLNSLFVFERNLCFSIGGG
jgi:hypothetical protein